MCSYEKNPYVQIQGTKVLAQSLLSSEERIMAWFVHQQKYSKGKLHYQNRQDLNLPY